MVVPEKTYRIRLDALVLDQGCERVLYGARPHPDGVELSGNPADFEELMSAVAFEANHETTRSRQRRWDDVYACLDPGSCNWYIWSTAHDPYAWAASTRTFRRTDRTSLSSTASLTRSARLLETTVQMIGEGALVSTDMPANAVPALTKACASDARMLRALVDEHGTPSDPLS